MNAIVARFLRRRLVGDALSLYAVQGLNYLLPLIMLPYLLRALGPHSYGSIMFAQSLMGYAAILTEFGYNFTAARDISVARADPRKVAQIYWTTMTVKLLLLALGMLVTAMVVLAVPALRQDWPVFLACSLVVVGSVAFPQWYFQGMEKLRDVALLQAISKCVVSISAVALVGSPQDLWIAAIILSSPQLIGAVAARCIGKPLAPPFYRPSLAELRQSMAGSWHMFAASASTTLYQHTNTFVLGLIAGDKAVALYSIGTRLVAAVQGFARPAIQAVFPRASLLFAEQPARARELLQQLARWLLPAMGVVSLLMAIFAPMLVHIIGGAEYAEAASIVRIMAVVPFAVTAAAILAQVVMVNIGLTAPLGRIYLAVGLLNLALLPMLVWTLAADGAAIALTLAEILGPIAMAVVIWRSGKLSRA